jgi:very-short-patch-repair endonuclease
MDDVRLENLLADDGQTPFFVKNLENVQGDERDTIILGVGYGKDKDGNLRLNFGPLNKEGGERRLNVAITRAKDNVKLVASISYTDIDLSRSNAVGSRLLRSYLDFAENGEVALERSVSVPVSDQFDSSFEEEVCDFLREQGFTVDTQIGCSGYRIDMGVRIPGSSDYVLAIECDGATYHSFANARDRDSLRQRVLESMGWRFYRIWSTDWFKNNAVEKERLLAAVRDALADAVTRASDNEEETEPAAVEETQYATEAAEQPSPFEEYRQIDAMAAIKRNGGNLQLGVREVLETEAPLSEELLLKRIVDFFDRKSVTKVVLREYERRMAGCLRNGIVRRDGFLYLSEQSAIDLRVPGVRREVRHVALDELAAGMLVLIGQNGSVTRDGLYRALGELLGFKRTGPAIAARFDEALLRLTTHDIVTLQDDVLTTA